MHRGGKAGREVKETRSGRWGWRQVRPAFSESQTMTMSAMVIGSLVSMCQSGNETHWAAGLRDCDVVVCRRNETRKQLAVVGGWSVDVLHNRATAMICSSLDGI